LRRAHALAVGIAHARQQLLQTAARRRAFLAAEPAGSFARNTRTELLREAVSADILARLPGIA